MGRTRRERPSATTLSDFFGFDLDDQRQVQLLLWALLDEHPLGQYVNELVRLGREADEVKQLERRHGTTNTDPVTGERVAIMADTREKRRRIVSELASLAAKAYRDFGDDKERQG